jgi:uncharacterized membrane protein YphA (DoxX/SURF4 family)
MNKKIPMGARLLLGLIFTVFGLNGFLNFIPQPPQTDPVVQAFMGGLFGTGYFFPFLKGTELLCGLALLSGTFAPLALIILTPIALNILLFHRMLAGGPPLDIIIFVLLLTAAYGYKEIYRPLLKAKTK